MMPSHNHVWKTLKRENNDERDNEIGAGNTDGVSNATAHIRDTTRGSTSRRTISHVPYDRRDLGDLRLAVREAEIERVLSLAGCHLLDLLLR